MTINIICETAPGFSFHYKKSGEGCDRAVTGYGRFSI